MLKTVVTTLIVSTAINAAVLAPPAAAAPSSSSSRSSAASQARALERAIETATLANCRVSWMRNPTGSSRNATFYRFMAECLDKQAAAH